MNEVPPRPTISWSVKLLGLAVLVVAAWLAFLWLSAALRTVLAVAGYVVVAVVAYLLGKAVGRASAEP